MRDRTAKSRLRRRQGKRAMCLTQSKNCPVPRADSRARALGTIIISALLALAYPFAGATQEVNIYFVHADHLGAPQALTDETGTVVWAADYDPFGNVSLPVSAVTNNIRFPGQYYDAETGLHYNYFRDYDPTTGRYIQSDPLGLSGGISTYLYASSNPLYYMDPFGRSSITWDELVELGQRTGTTAGRWMGSCFAVGVSLLLYTSPYDPIVAACDELRPQCPYLDEDTSDENDNDKDATSANDPLDDYPADPDDWIPPEGWTETSAGEKTGGRHRQWKDAEGNIRRRWDREGDPVRQPQLGPHWWDSRFPKKHILPNR